MYRSLFGIFQLHQWIFHGDLDVANRFVDAQTNLWSTVNKISRVMTFLNLQSIAKFYASDGNF